MMDRIEIVARALCEYDQREPDSKSPGNYTVPYDADYIGESNARHDGMRKITANYSEPWVFLWRRYGAKAMRVLEVLGDERRKAIDECIAVCKSVGKDEETGHLFATGADECAIAIRDRLLGPQTLSEQVVPTRSLG